MAGKLGENVVCKRVLELLVLSVGVILNAMGAGMFVVPYNFLCGGATGYGRFISYFTGMPVSWSVGIVAGALFLIGLITLGVRFAGTIILGTVLYPLALNVIEHFPVLQHLTDNKMLAACYGAILIGAGVGIVVRMGGSTGGSDVVAIVLNRKFGLNTAAVLNIVDLVALALQCTFAKSDDILFGILIITGYSIVMNKVLMFGSNDAQLVIVSEHWKKVNDALTRKANVGSTILHGKRGYTQKEQEIVMCTVSRRRLSKVKQVVASEDPMAFVTVLPASEVRGRGFSVSRNYGLEDNERKLG